jgi:hypothetical protein
MLVQHAPAEGVKETVTAHAVSGARNSE